jgi:hypothetical protein
MSCRACPNLSKGHLHGNSGPLGFPTPREAWISSPWLPHLGTSFSRFQAEAPNDGRDDWLIDSPRRCEEILTGENTPSLFWKHPSGPLNSPSQATHYGACLCTAKVAEFSWRKALLDHASVLCTEICSELTPLRPGVALPIAHTNRSKQEVRL